MGRCAVPRNADLVKNADENWPTASVTYPEVIAASPVRNRDDSRESLAEWSLAVHTGNG
jgi:hypothetical protein